MTRGTPCTSYSTCMQVLSTGLHEPVLRSSAKNGGLRAAIPACAAQAPLPRAQLYAVGPHVPENTDTATIKDIE